MRSKRAQDVLNKSARADVGRAVKRYCLVALALAGCSSASADPEASTPYRCDGIAVAAPRDTAAARTIATWRALATGLPGQAWLARIDRVASDVTPPPDVADRVRLQHQMLRVAQRLDGLRRTSYDSSAPLGIEATHHRVMRQIRAVAPTRDEIAALGMSSHPEVEAILGAEITERATKSCTAGNLKHVRLSAGLLAFRPLRAGATRALVAQLVAYDTDGEPHITPLVDGMELRIGDATTSPACVVRAGDDGVLRPMALEALEEDAPFVTRAGAGVGCALCHGAPNTMNARDLTNLDELVAIDSLRDAQVDRLARARWASLSSVVMRDDSLGDPAWSASQRPTIDSLR